MNINIDMDNKKAWVCNWNWRDQEMVGKVLWALLQHLNLVLTCCDVCKGFGGFGEGREYRDCSECHGKPYRLKHKNHTTLDTQIDINTKKIRHLLNTSGLCIHHKGCKDYKHSDLNCIGCKGWSNTWDDTNEQNHTIPSQNQSL